MRAKDRNSRVIRGGSTASRDTTLSYNVLREPRTGRWPSCATLLTRCGAARSPCRPPPADDHGRTTAPSPAAAPGRTAKASRRSCSARSQRQRLVLLHELTHALGLLRARAEVHPPLLQAAEEVRRLFPLVFADRGGRTRARAVMPAPLARDVLQHTANVLSKHKRQPDRRRQGARRDTGDCRQAPHTDSPLENCPIVRRGRPEQHCARQAAVEGARRLSSRRPGSRRSTPRRSSARSSASRKAPSAPRSRAG